MESQSKNALITGASSGIGYELAKLFARDGYDLVLVARNSDGLRRACEEFEDSYGVSVRVIATDLGRPEAAGIVFEELERAGVHVDVLVNNAGVGTYGAFAETDLEAELALIELNILSLTRLTRLFLGNMRAKGAGRILNVASTAAFQPGPLMAVYYASKAYVLSFSEALGNELHGSGVTVTVLCPGPTHTNFRKRAGMTASRLFDWGVMDAGTVAAVGYSGLLRNKSVVIPGLKNRCLAFAVRFLPRRLVLGVVRWMQGSRENSPSAPEQNRLR